MIDKLSPKITATISTLALLIAIGGGIWNFSDTSSKAKRAYQFSEEHHGLPAVVERQGKDIQKLFERVDRLEDLSINVAVMRESLTAIHGQLGRIENRIDRLASKGAEGE